MTTIRKLHYIDIDEYLDGEKRADVRHEYVHGAVYAIVGASVGHNMVSDNVVALLRTHIRGSPCRVFRADMKVRIDRVFYYPDIVLTCEKLQPDAYYLTSPELIVEVLSQSTEAKDRLEKRVTYQSLESLKEYVLVAQDRPQIEIIRRTREGWESETYGESEIVRFETVDLKSPIANIYEDALG